MVLAKLDEAERTKQNDVVLMRIVRLLGRQAANAFADLERSTEIVGEAPPSPPETRGRS